MTLVTVEEADVYFSTRLGTSEYWNSATEKTAALTTAENDIVAVYGSLTNKTCVYEQALFRLMDADLDRRQNLRAQGVTTAGIVKETYQKFGGIPLCGYVSQVLGNPYSFFAMPEMELDEDNA